jgi:hypothetical protein
MRIDYQKYEAASDRLTGLSATLEKQRQRVNDIRRELALTEMAVRRGLQFGISANAAVALGIHKRDPHAFMAKLAASPAEVVVALQEAGDGLSAICADYAQRHNALGHAMKSLAQTELEHGESQATVNRMRSFIASFNNVSTAMPRIV